MKRAKSKLCSGSKALRWAVSSERTMSSPASIAETSFQKLSGPGTFCDQSTTLRHRSHKQ